MIENFDPAVRKAARRIADHRRQLVIGRGLNCNAQLVEQAGDRAHFAARSIVAADVGNGLRLINDGHRQTLRVAVKYDHGGEQNVAHGGVARLQLGNPNFNRLRHGGVLSLPAADPICARLGAHRLSETSK